MNSCCQEALLISLQVDLDTIGLKSLHACLMKAGFSSTLLYLPGLQPKDQASMEEVGRLIRNKPPGFVGISLMSHEYFSAAALTAFIRTVTDKRIPVVWGGIHPTIAPEMCLAHADYVCVGEGETAMLELATAVRSGRRLDDVPNLWYKNGGKIEKPPLAPLIADLDQLPFADHLPENSLIAHGHRIVTLDKRAFKKYARWRGVVYSFMSSRGCPLACSYCCNDFLTRLYGTRVIRRRSVDNIVTELETAIRKYPDIEYINFQDDCFLACSDAYLTEFCEAYRKRIGRPFIVRCIPSFISTDRMEGLRQAGLSWISMGLQSGSDRVLSDVYNRRSSSRDFLAAAEIIHRTGVAAYYDVILDNPLETDADQLETIRVLSAVPRPYFLQPFSLVLFPGTSLCRRLRGEQAEYSGDYLIKNYHSYGNTDWNRLIRMSAYVPRFMISRLSVDRMKGGSSAAFRFWFYTTGWLSTFVMEPIAYFRVFRAGCRGEVSRMVKLLPAFFRIGLGRYIKQFRGKAIDRIERMIRDH